MGIAFSTQATPNSPDTSVPPHAQSPNWPKGGDLKLERRPLKQVYHEKLLGFDFESLAPEDRKLLLLQAKNYAAFLNKKMKSQAQAEYLAHCLSDFSDPFCAYLPKEKTQGESSLARSIRPSPGSLLALWKEAKLTELNTLNRKDLWKSLKLISEWSDLRSTANALIEQKSCASAELYFALGSKSEEYFPNEENRTITHKLYERVASCYVGSELPDSEDIRKVVFRLSLLDILDGDCQSARPHLELLADEKNGDFVTRALYWNAWCARKSGDKLRFQILQSRLLKANPLGYHHLSIRGGSVLEVSNLIYMGGTPQIQFRTMKDPAINQKVRTFEALLQLNEADLTRAIFKEVRQDLTGTEPEFQAYIAVLANRAGLQIPAFQVLGDLFRNDPLWITRDTLEMFFPVRFYESLWKQRGRVDPYLAAALIRQESGFVPYARSPAGAVGLMQLMPATARQIAHVSRSALFQPATNIALGVHHFHELLKEFGGDAELSLAAYNAGSRNVKKWVDRYPTENRMLFLDLIPFSETRDYVSLIARNYYWYLTLYAPSGVDVLSQEGRTPASLSSVVARFPAINSAFLGL